MFIYKEGDSSTGPCEACEKLVATTFRYAPYKYHDAIIPEVLQDFCDICGAAVSLPHQSSYRIREFREQYTHSLEIRIPGHQTDILLAIGSLHNISQKPNSLCRIISELYLSKMYQPKGLGIQAKIMEALDDDLAKGKSNDRLSCMFPDTTYAALKMFSQKESIKSSTVVKGIIVAAKHAILDEEDKGLTKEFELLAASRL